MKKGMSTPLGGTTRAEGNPEASILSCEGQQDLCVNGRLNQIGGFLD